MIEVRCTVMTFRRGEMVPCNRKLAEHNGISSGHMVIRCERCKTMITINHVDKKQALMV
jgi:phage FluMu protein Com